LVVIGFWRERVVAQQGCDGAKESSDPAWLPVVLVVFLGSSGSPDFLDI
jgi:hypothetical protein